MLKLFNTLSRKIENFTPLNPPQVSLYTCGQTVYDYTHIGHLSKYIGDDLLRRVLEVNNFKVKHVQNVTDVGHLVSDADEGDDKLEKGARDKNMTVWEVAKFFERYHFESLDQVNVLRPHVISRATEHIQEQIKLIQKLEEKGFTYQTEEAIYFETSKFPNYGALSGQKLEEKEVGVREEVKVDPQKKHPADFALWFFTVGRFKDHIMRWSSPWGEGFPGWHIECSAMSMAYLGDSLDIHTGGIDHIPVHHANEIAQSEAATGKQFVKYWVHHRFILVDGEKMSKSKKNFYTIDQIKERGFDPLALRYLFLTAHYRDPINFTWESLTASQNALDNLREIVREWEIPSNVIANEVKQAPTSEIASGRSLDPRNDETTYYQRFFEALNNDLNAPQALAMMWEVVKSDQPSSVKAQLLLKFDQVLGLKLDEYIGKKKEIPKGVMKLVEQREQARKDKDFERSDQLRKEIQKLGFEVLDTPEGPKIK